MIRKGNYSFKNIQIDFLEGYQIYQNPRTREIHMSEEESKLSNAKKTVLDLSLKIEEWNSKARLSMQELGKLKHRGQEQKALSTKKADSLLRHVEVMKDLEKVKQDLSKLKFEMGTVLEEKKRAEKEAKGLRSKMHTYLKSVDALRQEIEEVIDEQVLVQLAEIEAGKELADVEAQREVEAQKFAHDIEKIKQKMKEILERLDNTRELEMKLAHTNTDIEMLKTEIIMVKEMDVRVNSFRKENENNAAVVLNSVIKELEFAKSELASIRRDSFQLMASMDVIRKELIYVSGKAVRLKNKDKKEEEIAHNLDSKILKAKTKFEAVSSSEEKAKAIVDNLLLTCENLKTETEASKKERELICKETLKLKANIERNVGETELTEMKLEAALLELEAAKSSELVALEKLRVLAEKTRIDRAFVSKHSSRLRVSKFEYEYLTRRAAEAEEVADKKISAAQAWIEALKANEKEIHLMTEIIQTKMRQEREEEEENKFRMDKPIYRRIAGVGEWRENWDENLEVESSVLGEELHRKAMKKSGNSTPIRRTKLRISTSPGFRNTIRSSSINIKRREIMTNFGKLFKSKGIEN